MSTENKPRGLNILCIDGGGVRGLSSLILLSEIMKRLQGLEGVDRPSNPIDYFDVIAGTGTGGVSACMLGRLRMPLDEAIKAYTKLAKDVFSEKKGMGTRGRAVYKGTKLREALRGIVRKATGNENERMKERGAGGDGCKTMVFAMSKHNMNASIPVMFRSYDATTNVAPDCSIWEALYATMAHPDLFKPIDISDGSLRQTFVGGEIGCSNPITHVLAETRKLYPDRHVSCVLSIGAGRARTICILDPSPTERILLRTEEVVAMKDMATDSERVAEEMAARFQDTEGVYHRFNVDQGMQNMEAGEWERLSEVLAHTRTYVGEVDTNRGIEQVVQVIKERKGVISVAHLDGRIQVPAVKRASTLKRCPVPISVYTGREDKIHQVGTCITGGVDERRVCVIHGLGGAGKTQLALKTIELNRDSWKHVIYTDASSREAVESTLQDFAKVKRIGETYHETLIWLESCHEPWLVVFDNADDPALDIHEFFPGDNHGSILITSRLADMEVHARGPGSDCHISGMSCDDAMALLLRLTHKTDQELSVTERTAANSLLQDLGHLALAVVHAGAYIGHSHMNISKYRELFLSHRQSMLGRYDKLKVKVDGYRKSVYTTWKMCYDLLAENGNSRPLLWLMAYLHHDHITEDIFSRAAINIMSYKPLIPPTPVEAAGCDYLRDYLERFLDSNGQWDAPMFSDAINELASYSLIDFDRANLAYSIHVLVQEWTRTVIPQPQDLALECTTMLLARSIDFKNSIESYRFQRGLALHTSRVLSEQSFKPSANHAVQFASLYRSQGGWGVEETLERQVHETCLKLLGEEHPDTLVSMSNLASTYERQGQWAMAESMQVQVLDAKRRILGIENPHTLISMSNLALTYRLQGKWNIAESIQLQVLDMHKRILGEEHPDTLSSMGHLAATYHNQGRWAEAESMQIRILDLRKQVLGEEHPDTLTNMSSLALTYQNQGQWGMAESLQVKVLNSRKRILGEEHPHTLADMSNLASSYHNQGRWDMAEAIHLQVLDACKRVLGKEHPDTLTSMADLALTYQNKGRWDMAESIQVQLLDSFKRVFGKEHPHTLSNISNLASTYQSQGRWDMAESMRLQVLDACKRVLGSEHPHTLTSMNNLASTYMAQGRWDLAESIQVQVLDARKRVLGNEHPDMLTSMNNLALIYRDQGQWGKAESMQLQVLDAYKRVLGKEHPDTLTSMGHLATTYQKQGQWDMAESMQLQVLDVRKRILGNEHPDTLTSISTLALTYQSQGLWDIAESMYLQVLDVRKRILGNEHPNTLSVISNLALLYQKQGRWDMAESTQVQDLDACKRIHGNEHPDTLISMGNLAVTYGAQGRWDKAESMQLQVLEARKRVLGEEHPDTLVSMDNLAQTYQFQGRWEEAESIQLQVLDAFKRVLGNEHPDTLTSMSNLAMTYENQGRWDMAESIDLQLLDARKRVLGNEHPDTLGLMNDLALTYQNQGRWDMAESIQLQVLDTHKQVFGEDHPHTLNSMNNLASTYQHQGRWDKAGLLQVHALDVQRRSLGQAHPDTLSSMEKLAWTYHQQARWEAEEAVLAQLADAQAQAFGPLQPHVLRIKGHLELAQSNRDAAKRAADSFISCEPTEESSPAPPPVPIDHSAQAPHIFATCTAWTLHEHVTLILSLFLPVVVAFAAYMYTSR